MISTLFAIGYALFATCAIALFVKHDNFFTLRQRRKIFVIALFGNLIASQLIMHVQVDCDLRANATTPCVIGWL